MAEIPSSLIARQKAELETWHADAADIGDFIAGDVWDALERKLENLTSDGLMWDFADFIQTGLLITLAMRFDEACERWISNRIEALSDAMQAAAGPVWDFDTERASLDSLRKGLRIRQRMTPKFERIFDTVKPGFLRMLARALADDADYVLEDMDKDAQKDAANLRAAFHAARSEISGEIARLAADLLRRTLHDYMAAMATVQSRSGTVREEEAGHR
ncbi:hypothetical protein [Thauera aromatica]|uniref:Uncharacterized protein n=1 Tax=Thauera aromatica K172 TaxID=44139 RepID=A0A2R4BS91_THAAR|nr:hypothetical protein [Thauera aromatica]AVR90211.1 hypothetical protein Tharo_3330 [Thauera aromatica K172]